MNSMSSKGIVSSIERVCASSPGPHDIDVLLETEERDVQALGERLVDLDPRWQIEFGIKFYFVRELSLPSSSTAGAAAAVENSPCKVLIETLVAGTLGLPVVAGPVYSDPNYQLKLLHPSVLPFTKFKRWHTMRRSNSTRPRSQMKVRTDEEDIIFLIQLLADMKMKLALQDYAGTTRGELLDFVATFYNSFKVNEELCATLKEVMHAEDWEEMLQASVGATLKEVMHAEDGEEMLQASVGATLKEVMHAEDGEEMLQTSVDSASGGGARAAD